MEQNKLVDYLAAIESLRQDEIAEKHQIYDADRIPMADGPVDYLAITKAWDELQTGKYVIHLHAKKRNPSHDPE